MRVISLIPKNKEAKKLIKIHGDRWEVIEARSQVAFDGRRGPWILIQPLTEERAPADNIRASRIESASRWVHEHNDVNFQIAP